MGANCKQKDYIRIAEDGAFPRSGCASLIQQLNDSLANLHRSRQNHIQRHGSKNQEVVCSCRVAPTLSCAPVKATCGLGTCSLEQRSLLPDISQTRSAAGTLPGLGQWRPARVTWDHIRTPSCRLCHRGEDLWKGQGCI